MFIDRSVLIAHNKKQLNYGVAVTDIDGDGQFEFIVTGFGFPNRVFKWNGEQFTDIADAVLADAERQAIGLAAADIDGNGIEELYILNTDTFNGRKEFSDRLFVKGDDSWLDLFSLDMHKKQRNLTAGRSVIAVDRTGDGLYGFFVSNYGGPMRLYELDDDGRLQDVAAEAGVALTTGGRSAISLPIVSEYMDIFAANENGPNFLFRNRGDGTFDEIGEKMGVSDPFQHGRGIAAIDANGDGRFDLVGGNWEGPHRLFIRSRSGIFRDEAPPTMAASSRLRTVIVADFDNDGYEEIFFNNIGEANRLFGWRQGAWRMIDIGSAREMKGLGTGATVGDFNRDGRLELIVAHGEMNYQPLSLYSVLPNSNHWFRVMPLTQYGAPARGAVVELFAGTRKQIRTIDAGSGYLCQMEPVAHFGLGTVEKIDMVRIQWPDGSVKTINNPVPHTTLRVNHPKTLNF